MKITCLNIYNRQAVYEENHPVLMKIIKEYVTNCRTQYGLELAD